uniref:Uncharacterized protein TP-0789 domain-containing protein n=1 Tax=Sorangium cellulosum TaxID=56 RepID=A0A0M4LAJ0_SORCE|nr:hypothetical protein [Sorangium cellulosum]
MMKTIVWFLAFALALVAGSGAPFAAGADKSPTAILDHVDDIYRGSSSHAKMTLHVVTAHATRDMEIEAWSKGKDRFLIRIIGPEKERGTGTLKLGNNVWNYFPKIDRLTKISASMMGGSWMGSHVTNGDLVKQSRMSADYDHKKTFEGARDGTNVIELSLTPKPNAAVVWGKIVVTVRAEDMMPRTIVYYDEDGKLSQTTTFADYKTMGGRLVPSVMRVVPASKPKELTEIRYHSLEFNLPLNDDFFSQRNLQK